MKFPSITSYIKAVANLEERLHTLEQIVPILDNEAAPIFHSSKGAIIFPVLFRGKVSSIRCFTSVLGYEQTAELLKAEIISGELYQDELLVFDNNRDVGEYYPIFISSESKELGQSDIKSDHLGELHAIEKNGLFGYANSNDKVIIEYKYDQAWDFEEGRAVVGIKGMYGLIDVDGRFVLDLVFDEISWDGSAIAYVDMFGKWGCYDRLGREMVKCKYEWMGEFSNSMLLIKKNGKYGYLNYKGEEVIAAIYDNATSFNDQGLANVQVNGVRKVITDKGEIEVL